MAKVNLDALIAREDFEVEENINSGKKKETISIEDIKADSFFFSNIRKPDFQRETNEWDSQKVCELIRSFIEGDLIPAIILWRSTGGYLFVIDGSHRLSALSAWVNDDYGDGKISKFFYDGTIPDEQLEIAQETRKLINKIIGSYEDFRLALTYPDKVKPEIVKYAKNLGALAIQLQWVEGDARKAENSFFKINQQAAPIDKTELKLLESRKKPNSIAARAIIRSGKGHKYWSLFSNELQSEIQDLAAEINAILFAPKLQTPVKTLDLPVGGKLYGSQTLPLILDFVNIVNKLDSNNKGITDDNTGELTLKFLKEVKKVSRRLNSNHSSSLGLHPAVYFYSQEGRHKPASFFAIVDFIMELDKRGKVNNFIDVRSTFEEFIIEYDYLIQQIHRKYRSSQKSYPHISKLFLNIVSAFKAGKNSEESIKEIVANNEFSYLALQNIVQQDEYVSKDFSTNQKSAIYMREALQTAPRCKICGGFIHRNSISIDHVQRKQDGGLATLDNGQLTHPYCNTGYKN
ncbi:GmrSD restriction endonuclease domain-containing protein [Calothrix sp. 336/3]|uniref:GmrSD restriction endonuclease domain-containing protein n=1 Tax=Calothrix sp. 336/3 TaxID=1337936 RepID=UPI0004E3A35C|nr:DUF262 domain-containing protein [Calothrix sp. 336/3]AKG21569.1 hypothetical protein IJ00_10035 [Calothrix sp. 336/3]